MKNKFLELPIPTREGQFIARYSKKGLAEMDFPATRPTRRVDRTSLREFSAASTDLVSRWHRTTEAALKNVSPGARRKPCHRWTRPERNFSGQFGANFGRFPSAKQKATAKSRGRLADPGPSAPLAARAARIQSRFWSPAIVCWPRTKNSAASAEDWNGNADCLRGKVSVCSSQRQSALIMLERTHVRCNNTTAR